MERQSPESAPSTSSAAVSERYDREKRSFASLRSLQWRINLGSLPSSPSASIDDLRRVTADSRRRYASLRRRLLVDPHIPRDGAASPDLAKDNPLSLNPDSTWGRFFQNAELEKMVDQDLSRLYPEHGSYFQTAGCQGMLRRILLLWCLRHPECGYRQDCRMYHSGPSTSEDTMFSTFVVSMPAQDLHFGNSVKQFLGEETRHINCSLQMLNLGMHELLAPLLYVLQIDVERLVEVRKLYEEHFTDRFDGLQCQHNDLSYRFDFRKSSDLIENETGSNGNGIQIKNLDELEPEIQTIILLSDAYGAEGELGVVLSEKFIEHDAYCMFDALMSGARGAVATADFFLFSPTAGSNTGLPPAIEASSALYHILFLVDPSLHSHLVDIGAEPQYFALRWLRVLFGREFTLQNLLIIWDEIFASDNNKIPKKGEGDKFMILESPRGTFIASIAVSMLLYLRSSLLASENATTCLQRLLNFPEDINLTKLLERAKSLQDLALNANISSSSVSLGAFCNQGKPTLGKFHTFSRYSVLPRTSASSPPESYWEEQWRVQQKEEELGQESRENQVSALKKGWTEKVKLRLKRTKSDPSKAETKPSVRRSLLDDLSRQLGLEEDDEEKHCQESLRTHENPCEEGVSRQDVCKENRCIPDDRSIAGSENSSCYMDAGSPLCGADDHEIDLDKSSVASNISMDETNDHSRIGSNSPPLRLSHPPMKGRQMSYCSDDSTENSTANLRESNLSSNKFHLFWKFGRHGGEDISVKGGCPSESTNTNFSNENNITPTSKANGHCNPLSCNGDAVDQSLMMKLGQSMLEHIEVLESVIQHDRGGVLLNNYFENCLVGKRHVSAMTALKELRKISNLLSEKGGEI